jgi:hypothetical protein
VVTPANSRPSLERWLALVVRYWAFNMSLALARGMRWPGFRYSDEETAALERIAAGCDRSEFAMWLGLTVVLYLVIAAMVVVAGMNGLIVAIGGEQHMADTPAVMFFFALGLELVVAMSIGFPAAMLPAAALTGRFFGVADAGLPAPAIVAHHFRKLWFQIARVAVLAVAVLAALWFFVPADSKVALLARTVMPLLSPAVAALTAAYYFSARLARAARAPDA